MHQNNTNTDQNHRFFVPRIGEIGHHESFNATDIPQVTVVPGEESYAVTEDGAAHKVYYQANVPSGSIVKKIIGYPDNLSHISGDQASRNEPTGEYAIQPDDLLIVQADTFQLRRDEEIVGLVGHDKVMLVPAGQPLPFSNGKGEKGESKSLHYTIVGAITTDLKLVSWPGTYGGGQNASRIIDLCVVNANVQNRLELALLDEDIGSGSLIGTLSTHTGARAYLHHYDTQRGTNYTPTVDPFDRYREFPETFGEQQFILYRRLAALAAQWRP